MQTGQWRGCLGALLAILSLRLALTEAAGSSGATDAAALLALKTAATNAKFDSWVGDAPCGAKPWQYISCNQDRVVGLELGGRGVQGTLPPELATMDQLQLLSLGGNAFTGGLPAAWGAATAFPLLVSMDINGSSLTGALPTSWGTSGALAVLQTLTLDGNRLTGSVPQTWGSDGALPLITALSLSNNSLSGALPPTWCNDAASLPAIQTLQLDGNALTGTLPGYWGGRGCQQMTSIDLHGNNLSGALPTYWASQGYWPKLQTLRLDGNALSGTLPAEWTSPTAFPAMRGNATGIVVQPGNANLNGTVPLIQFRILAVSANGTTTAIPNLRDPVQSSAPPPPANQPPPSSANSTAAQTATVTAMVRLTGSSLWPFTALQQAGFKSVVLAGLGSGNTTANITEAQLTIGAAKLSTDSVSQYASIKEKGRRRLLQDVRSVEVPVYVLTTVGKAAAVETAVAALVKSSALQTDLKAAGFQLNDVILSGIDSAQGDSVPPPAANTAQAAAPAPASTASSSGSGSPNVAAIVGGVVGGLVGLALLGALVWAWIRRRRQDRQRQFITHRTIVKPTVRQASVSSATLPYRKTTLATVQEAHSGERSAVADAIGQHPPDSPGGSSRGGRLTQGLYRTHNSGPADRAPSQQGLYRTHSSGSGEANLLDHMRTGGVHSSNFFEQAPVHTAPGSGAQQAGSATPLTQSALGAHTRFTNPNENNASWTARFSRTFAMQ